MWKAYFCSLLFSLEGGTRKIVPTLTLKTLILISSPHPLSQRHSIRHDHNEPDEP